MRIALVTGASSGMGREFAKQITQLYKHLDAVWIVARRVERLEAVKAELESETGMSVKIFDGDLSEDSIYERIERELAKGRADIRMLVNCAGYGKMGLCSDIPEKEQIGMIDLNCRSLTKMILTCMPYFTGGSRIINLASAAAFAPQPGFAVYAASKAYVKSFSHGLGEELKERGIYVTSVCPGPVDTEFFERSGKLPGEGRRLKRAETSKVVHKALSDAAARRSVSVYGISMKSAGIASKIFPDALTAFVMKKVNHI